ncbi:MAG: hypothetical protein GY861_13085 [bacterium]|nr:hypothetical protein [bacterium]
MHTKYNLNENVTITIETVEHPVDVIGNIRGIRTTSILDDEGAEFVEIEYLIHHSGNEMQWVYEDVLLEMNRK